MIFKENEINKLKEQIEKLKSQWKTIVWTNGCFDIIHPGHIQTFKTAKKLGDIVIVWVNGDKSPYRKTKPWRPINDENFRSQMLNAIKYVDFVYIFNDETPVRPVEILKPNIVLKGGDYYIREIEVWRVSEEVWRDNIEKIKEYNKIVETELVKKANWFIDVSWIYKFFIENNLTYIVKNIKWYMPEWEVCVKYWGKVVLVPVVEWYSTTNIVEKIRPKQFFDLVMFWKKYKSSFNDLKDFIEWFYKKLNIHYLHKIRFKWKIKQYSIFLADLWKNIGNEVNKLRPVLIISWTSYSSVWTDIIIAPITGLYNKNWKIKKIYHFDIVLENDYKKYWLEKPSIIRLSWLREISKKRLKEYLWKLDKNFKNIIDEKLKIILNIK